MDYLWRVAVGLASAGSVLREWPLMQALPASGALLDLVLLRSVEGWPRGKAALRALGFWAVLEGVVVVGLVMIQSYFYWAPG